MCLWVWLRKRYAGLDALGGIEGGVARGRQYAVVICQRRAGKRAQVKRGARAKRAEQLSLCKRLQRLAKALLQQAAHQPGGKIAVDKALVRLSGRKAATVRKNLPYGYRRLKGAEIRGGIDDAGGVAEQ